MLPFGPTDPNVKTFFWKFTICQPQIMKGSQHQLLPAGSKAFKSETMLCDRKLKSCLRIICFISRYCSKIVGTSEMCKRTGERGDVQKLLKDWQHQTRSFYLIRRVLSRSGILVTENLTAEASSHTVRPVPLQTLQRVHPSFSFSVSRRQLAASHPLHGQPRARVHETG